MIANVLTHSSLTGSFQFSHSPAIPNGEPSFIAMAKGCFGFCPLIAFHSKKPSIGRMHRRRAYVPECGKRRNRLGLGIDRLATALRVAAPVRDQPPFQEIQGPLGRPRVLPDDEQLLARRGVVAARHIREPAVPHVEPIDDREAKWIRGLNSRQNPSD